MRIIEPGHVYGLDHLDGDGETVLTFVRRGDSRAHEGTQNQQVLCALINRMQYLDEQRSWARNKEIIFHLRMALVLHEARVLERKVEEGKIDPERVITDTDGHYKLYRAGML